MSNIKSQIKCECCRRSELIILLVDVAAMYKKAMLKYMAEEKHAYSFAKEVLKETDKRLGRHNDKISANRNHSGPTAV